MYCRTVVLSYCRIVKRPPRSDFKKRLAKVGYHKPLEYLAYLTPLCYSIRYRARAPALALSAPGAKDLTFADWRRSR
jgi:hypothetical protein